MSPKFHHTAELSTADFAAFDDLLLGQNPSRGNSHLYVVDHLLDVLHGGKNLDGDDFPYKNLTVKYYAGKVLRHVQQRLLRPKIATFLEAVEPTDDDSSGFR
jgi:hypothetical protein